MRSIILWIVVVGLSVAAVLLRLQAGWAATTAALLQCLMLAAIIRDVERRPITSIRWWLRFSAAVRRHRTVAVVAILLLMATAASHVLTLLENLKQNSPSLLVWLSIELAIAAAIGLIATARRGNSVTVDLAIAVSLFLSLFFFNLLIGTLVSSTNAAQALAPEMLRDDAARLSLIILISTVVTLLSAWASGPSAIGAKRHAVRDIRQWRWLDGVLVALFVLLTIHWAPRFLVA